MAFIPIPSVTQTTQLISLAKSVVSVASATFAGLLNATTYFSSPSSSAPDSKILQARTVGELFSRSNSHLSLRIENEALLEDFHSTFVEELRQLGIDISSGIELEFSEMGTIDVVGQHPEKTAIEIVLAGNPRYFEAVQKIAMNSVLTESSPGLANSREFRLSVNGTRAQVQFV